MEHIRIIPNDNELDLRALVLEHCDKTNDVEIKQLLDKELPKLDSGSKYMQKMLLNRYFSNLLFRYRSISKDSVLNTLPFLLEEGTNGDWFGCYIQFVYPFLKTNNVFNKVYGLSL